MGRREQGSLKRLRAELERLAGELGGLDDDESQETTPGRERLSDRLRRRLSDARRARGMRQVDLADRLGRPQSFVSNYERGDRRLEVSEFIVIAGVLGIDPAAIVAELAAEGDARLPTARQPAGPST